MSNISTRCAACKSLRRRCSEDCVLRPYFPANDSERFACVHKIFGSSNATKMLEQLPMQARRDAAECMSYEASLRVQDPVYGCTGIIFQLQQQIIQFQYEMARVQAEIAYSSAQLEQQRQIMDQNHSYHAAAASTQASWMNISSVASDEQQQFYLDIDHDQQPHFHQPPQF